MRWRRLLILLAVCAVLSAVVAALIPREPKYEGRTLSEWIKDSAPRRSPDPETTRAVEAVRHIGTNGLPWLIKWIGAKEPADWKLKLTSANMWLPRWVRLRFLPNLLGLNSYYARRRLALDGFVILGPQASPATPELLKIADMWAADALDSIGLAALGPMLEILTNRTNSATLRAAAAVRIRNMDQKFDLAPVVPVLTRCVREKEPIVAKESAKALVKLGVEPELTVAFFTGLLQQGDVINRCEAAENLRVLGEKARSAVPALVNATRDSDWYVRRAAVMTLYRIDPDALEKAIPGSVAAINQSHAFGD